MYGSDLLRIAKNIILAAGLLGAIAVIVFDGAQAQQAGQEDYSAARLRALNKLTAELVVIDASVDSAVDFGSLSITVRACRKPASKDEDDSVVFLEILDRAAENKKVFGGWMFASSPSLSALEHPLYDVWVESCITF